MSAPNLTNGEWSDIKTGFGRQKHGPIRVAKRNTDLPVDGSHQNRAGHRQYVRTLQTRQGRINIVGWGKWRKHRDRTEESVAWETRIALIAPRRERRAWAKAHKYRGE